MRGAKAKELRRLAKNAKLPDIAYGIVPRSRLFPDPKDPNKLLKLSTTQLVLGKCKRGMVQHAKKRRTTAPIVGMSRAIRKAVAEMTKNMTITPIEAPK